MDGVAGVHQVSKEGRKEDGRADTRASPLKGKEGQSAAAERARLKGSGKGNGKPEGQEICRKNA